MNEIKPVGLTKAAGYQIGVRRTFSIPVEAAWELIVSEQGVNLWLGEVAMTLSFRKGESYLTEEGITGEIRVVNPRRNIRLTWRKPGWSKPSMLQIRTIAGGAEKTVISFHQEHLADAQAREEMKRRWEAVLSGLQKRISESAP